MYLTSRKRLQTTDTRKGHLFDPFFLKRDQPDLTYLKRLQKDATVQPEMLLKRKYACLQMMRKVETSINKYFLNIREPVPNIYNTQLK